MYSGKVKQNWFPSNAPQIFMICVLTRIAGLNKAFVYCGFVVYTFIVLRESMCIDKIIMQLIDNGIYYYIIIDFVSLKHITYEWKFQRNLFFFVSLALFCTHIHGDMRHTPQHTHTIIFLLLTHSTLPVTQIQPSIIN